MKTKSKTVIASPEGAKQSPCHSPVNRMPFTAPVNRMPFTAPVNRMPFTAEERSRRLSDEESRKELFRFFGFASQSLRMTIIAGVVICIFSFMLVSQALADTVYLTSGEAVKGLVVEEHHDRIVFSTYKGEIEIPKFSIDQIFFDTEEGNQIYLGNKALDEGEFELALGFYQKAYQINPDLEKVKGALVRLLDAINRKNLNISPQDAPVKLKEQLGIAIERHKNKIRVLSVNDEPLAKKAGLAVSDIITNVWDASVMFMDSSSAALLMTGAPQTPIKLTIEREIRLPVSPVPWFKRIFKGFIFNDFGFKLALKPSGLIAVYVGPQGIAVQCGLQVMDEVTRINGESTRYMPVSLVRKKIFQSNLKEVVLTIKRQVFLIRGGQ